MPTQPKLPITLEEASTIAKEAYIYGFPIVDNMRIQYSYFVDRENPEYKGSYNQICNIPRVYTPEDKAVQTPNSDTPYSWIGLDLRTEPIVVTVPPIEKERYWSLQLIDLYTHNFDYLGSRATGNGGGSFAIAGPNWQGGTPAGIEKVIRCETQIALGLFRTQLYNPNDLENVKQIQQQYRVQSLSAFLGQPSPEPAPAIDFPKPLTPEAQKTSLEFFDLLNVYLQFCPTHPSEIELRERFARIGIEAGKKFTAALSPELKQAVENGITDAWKEFDENKKINVDTGKLTAADGFGTREFLQNNYLFRMTSAALGIYGNSKEEALYPAYYMDAEGQKLNGTNRYTVRFGPNQLPPAHAFWSITMYELPASLLVANPLDRYLINSAMLPHLKQDDDQGITLYIQNKSPGEDQESNWLPAPPGPFWVTVRLYWPKEEALNGTWKLPPMYRVKEA
jgi:hypothetical protein